jgi:diguanylate cyclase (GGDEF)-like protein/PAS domain S-box-containing protein
MEPWLLFAVLPVVAALSAFAVMRVKRAVAAREQAQLALREAELRYRTLVEQMPTVTYMDRIDERDPTDVMPHYMSPQIETLLGYTAEEWLEDPDLWTKVVHPEDRARVVKVGDSARLAGGPFEAEYRMVRRDGEVVWVRESSVLIGDESGRPRFWQGTYVDATDRKAVENALRESEQQYHGLFEENHAAMLLTDPASGVIVDANPAACEFYGYERERMLLMRAADLSTSSEEDVFAEMQRASAERRAFFEFRHRLASGEVRDVEVYSGPLTVRGRPVLYSLIHDATERRLAERALRESERRFRAIFDGAAVGILRLDLEGRILESNPAFTKLLGFPAEEMRGMPAEAIVHPDDAPSLGIFDELVAGSRDRYEAERRYVRKDGTEIWGHAAVSLVRDEAGSPGFAILMIEDVTARKLAEEELSHRAFHDPLTDLPNRELFIDRLGVALARVRRGGGELAVLFLDLDRFKEVNDTLGHSAGDRLLVAVARRVEAGVRPSDTVSRFGGDEFVILCEDVAGEVGAAQVAERIRETLERPVMIGDHEVAVNASIGVAMAGKDSNADELLRRADAAMYRAKDLGRDRYEVATS